ncbi:MAG: hypothetical protein M5U28_18480 [Sandaracinaceae bacterium]|nr:hypothetical protein [Sandaracinaceae bacterium]
MELERGPAALDRAGGAVHATEDVALVIASTRSGRVGVLVTTDEPAERIGSFEASHAWAHSTESGFVLSSHPECSVDVVGADLTSSRTIDLSGGDALDPRCLISQTAPGRIEVAVTEGSTDPRASSRSRTSTRRSRRCRASAR